MKKTLILCGLAAFAALTASAECEKMSFFKNGMPSHNVMIDANSTAKYTGQGGYTHLNITDKNGDTKEIAMGDFDHFKFANILAENPITIEVERHYTSATLDIKTSNVSMWYRVTGMPTRHLQHIDKSAWADYLVQDDINYVYGVAADNNIDLSKVSMQDVFEQGNQVRDWFPDEAITDNTPIALVAYTGRLINGKIQVTSEPLLIEFTTKKQDALPVKINITGDMTSTRLTVKYDPVIDEELLTEDNKDTDPKKVPYLTALYSGLDAANYGLEQMVYVTLLQAENMVYNNGYEWDELTGLGHCEQTFYNRRTGDLWVAIAFGCEYGVQTTQVSYEIFEIPNATVVDNCTFDISYTQKSPAEVEVKVVPSDPNTAYVAFLARKDRIAENQYYDDYEYYFANKVYWVNVMNTFQWHSTDYLHQGEFTFNSYTDLIDGEYLQADVEYEVIVAGIDEVGTRLTELAHLPVKTSAVGVNKFSFDISFKNFIGGTNFYHWITLDIKPSDPNARYIVEDLAFSNAYAQIAGRTDEQIIKDLTSVDAQYLKFHKGNEEVSVYDAGSYNGQDVYEGRRIMVFGYDGVATSDLYVFDWDSVTGEIVQLRGPQVDCTVH